MDLDATHRPLESRIKTPHSLANTPGERDRATDTDKHAAAAATIERGIDEAVEMFDKTGASRDEGDTWREVHSIQRFDGRASVEYREAQASGITLGNESREKGDHWGQRS